MVTLSEAFSHLQKVNVLVIGDVLVDLYTVGSVQRISPEAPVPVLLVSSTHSLPGAAGNVALNLQALGANVLLVGRVGDDPTGGDFVRLLEEKGLSTAGIVTQKGIKTPLKNRFIASDQQLMRADFEIITHIDEETELAVKQIFLKELSNQDIVAISDYGKGFLSNHLIAFVIEESRKRGIQVIVDPKGSDFAKYNGAYMIKPNTKEAYAASGLECHKSLTEVAAGIFSRVSCEYLLITRSEKGMSLLSRDEKNAVVRADFPVEHRDVNDVTGAGDTALAMIAFGIANLLELPHVITLANIASGIAVEKLGCVAVKLSEMAKPLLEKDVMSKVFDDIDNSFVLRQVIENHPIILLNLGEESEMNSKIFHTIRDLNRKKGASKLIVQIKPTLLNKDFIHLLASMHEVDFIIAKNISIDFLQERLDPVMVCNMSKQLEESGVFEAGAGKM